MAARPASQDPSGTPQRPRIASASRRPRPLPTATATGREPDPVPAPSRCAVSVAALRAGGDQPDCTWMSSSRILSPWARAWCPQKRSSPPEGRTARTLAAAPQRSQRSAAVNSGRERVPGCTAVSLRLDTGCPRCRSMRRTAFAVRPLLQTHGTPVTVPGVRRDTRHVVTVWRSGRCPRIARGGPASGFS